MLSSVCPFLIVEFHRIQVLAGVEWIKELHLGKSFCPFLCIGTKKNYSPFQAHTLRSLSIAAGQSASFFETIQKKKKRKSTAREIRTKRKISDKYLLDACQMRVSFLRSNNERQSLKRRKKQVFKRENLILGSPCAIKHLILFPDARF